MLVDGIPSSTLSVSDRGLNYGDGLFETMRLYKGGIPLLARHLKRLREGCRRIGLRWPGTALLESELARLPAAGSTEGVIRLVLTRGDGGRGYAPPLDAESRRILTLHALPEAGPASLAVGICKTRLGSSPALAGLKHLGRLEQVLAGAEVADAGWDEGLMLDEAGQVVEATRHNLFFLRDGRFLTPPVDRCGVAGVMRALVLECLGRAGIPGGEAPLRYDGLDEIEAMFLCNAVVGVKPVARLAGRECAVDVVSRVRGLLVDAEVAWLA